MIFTSFSLNTSECVPGVSLDNIIGYNRCSGGEHGNAVPVALDEIVLNYRAGAALKINRVSRVPRNYVFGNDASGGIAVKARPAIQY